MPRTVPLCLIRHSDTISPIRKGRTQRDARPAGKRDARRPSGGGDGQLEAVDPDAGGFSPSGAPLAGA